jgi:hypothetical protein
MADYTVCLQPMDVPSEASLSLQEPTASTSADTEFGMSDVADIKAALLDSLYGTERGLAARSEIRAEVGACKGDHAHCASM